MDAFDLGVVTSECNETSGLRGKYFGQTFPTVQQRGQDAEMPLSNLVNADIGFILRMEGLCLGRILLSLKDVQIFESDSRNVGT